MRKKIIFAFSTVLSVALSVAHAFGAVYYVATDGKDGNTGSKDKPFATLNKANAVVAAGDTVWIRGGVYTRRHDRGEEKGACATSKSRVSRDLMRDCTPPT